MLLFAIFRACVFAGILWRPLHCPSRPLFVVILAITQSAAFPTCWFLYYCRRIFALKVTEIPLLRRLANLSAGPCHQLLAGSCYNALISTLSYISLALLLLSSPVIRMSPFASAGGRYHTNFSQTSWRESLTDLFLFSASRTLQNLSMLDGGMCLSLCPQMARGINTRIPTEPSKRDQRTDQATCPTALRKTGLPAQ